MSLLLLLVVCISGTTVAASESWDFKDTTDGSYAIEEEITVRIGITLSKLIVQWVSQQECIPGTRETDMNFYDIETVGGEGS